MNQQPNMTKGAAFLFAGFGLLFLILIIRFAFLQIGGQTDGRVLAVEAEKNYRTSSVIEANRGSVLDRNGEPIAVNASSFRLVAVLAEQATEDEDEPRHVVDPEKTASELATVLDMEESAILEQLKDGISRDRYQVEFGNAGRRLSQTEKEKIESMNLPGVLFQREQQRFYPNGVFASHVIGYTSYVTNEDDGTSTMVGELGLEKSLNDLLKATDGTVVEREDYYGLPLFGDGQEITPAIDGKNVTLTLDKKIQTFLEDAMNRVDEKYKPKRMMAIVADPKTGEILAMGQRPSFHPATRVGLEDSWYNENVESRFEPGSTMKSFTLAAAINEGKFPANETFLSGSLRVPGGVINDYNEGVGWGPITFLEGIQRSSNVGISLIARDQLGYDNLYRYLQEFGFDQVTGIGLPGEIPGRIQYEWELEKLNTAFGQGTSVTPIQQIQAFTAIANDGKMMKPQIVKEVFDPNKEEVVTTSEPVVVNEPITAETAKEVRDILETVVTSANGTGNIYSLKDAGYDVFGKTGTAQIYDNEKQEYLSGEGNYIYSFLGGAPVDDPKLIMLVAVQQPELNGEYSSNPVAQIFKPVMSNSLSYLNIKPSDIKKTKSDQVPNVKGKSVKEAIDVMDKVGFQLNVVGSGSNITEQMPVAGTELMAGERVLVKTDGDILIPDLIGWSFQDVMKWIALTNVELNAAGSGYVVDQSVPAGTPLEETGPFVINFQRPYENFRDENMPETEEVEINPVVEEGT